MMWFISSSRCFRFELLAVDEGLERTVGIQAVVRSTEETHARRVKLIDEFLRMPGRCRQARE